MSWGKRISVQVDENPWKEAARTMHNGIFAAGDGWAYLGDKLMRRD